jgi:hypothetical protein
MEVEVIRSLPNKNKFYEVCLSVSLFRMQSSYKPFEKYITMFEKIVKTIFPQAYVRLYVDRSAMQEPAFQALMNKKYSNLEVYRFEDKRFLLEDGIHHDGTFGSIARFLALFDKSIKANYVWIADADLNTQDFNYNLIREMKHVHASVSYASRGCYDKYWIPLEVDFPIINYKVVVRKNVKCSFEKFNNFLDEVHANKYNDVKEKIEAIVNRPDAKRKMLGIKQFIYGFDELYSNGVLYKELVNYRRLVLDDLQLNYLGNFKDIPIDKEKAEKYNKLMYYGAKSADLKKKVIKFYEDLYDEIVEKDLMKTFDEYPRIKRCVNEFNMYKNKVNMKDINLFAYIVVDPRTYRKSIRNTPSTVEAAKMLKDKPMSPVKVKTKSPVKVKTMSPMKVKTKSPVKVKTMSPMKVKTKSPVKVKTISPMKVKTMSPMKVKTMSPMKVKSKSPVKVKTMSPMKVKTKSPEIDYYPELENVYYPLSNGSRPFRVRLEKDIAYIDKDKRYEMESDDDIPIWELYMQTPYSKSFVGKYNPECPDIGSSVLLQVTPTKYIYIGYWVIQELKFRYKVVDFTTETGCRNTVMSYITTNKYLIDPLSGIKYPIEFFKEKDFYNVYKVMDNLEQKYEDNKVDLKVIHEISN